MIISHSKKFIFLRTRKTASATIQSFLLQHLNKNDFATHMNGIGFSGLNCDDVSNGPSHVTINHAISQNYPIEEDKLKDYFIFCFERNPWRKCISHYHYHKEYAENSSVLWAKDMSFDEYIDNNNFPKDFNMYQRNNKSIADFIGKYENLYDDMKTVCDRLEITFNGFDNHLHKGKSNIQLNDYYTDSAMIDKIRKSFNNEIQLLGYEYE